MDKISLLIAVAAFVLEWNLAVAKNAPTCILKEFTENPKEVKDSCGEAIENRWRGELSLSLTERHIEVEWKRIVQDSACVKAMELFVDGVKQRDIWGRHKEKVRLEKMKTFALKVEVYFLIPGSSGTCYGVPEECRCFEARSMITVPQLLNETYVAVVNNGTLQSTEIPSTVMVFAAAGGGAPPLTYKL